VHDLKKRGEPAATDLPVIINQLTVKLANILHLNQLLGYLGLSLEEKKSAKGEEKSTKTEGEGKVVPITIKPQLNKERMEAGKMLGYNTQRFMLSTLGIVTFESCIIRFSRLWWKKCVKCQTCNVVLLL
jgi:hypothetical protein